MAAPSIPATSNAFIGYGVEATPGTVASTFVYSPLKNPSWVPKQTYLEDIGLDGSPAVPRDVVMGVSSAEMGWKTNLFADVFPYLAHGLLGVEAVTGTTAPYTHTESLLNNVAGSQPPSLSVVYFDGGQARQLLWTQLTKMDIAMSVEAAVEATITSIALPATNIAAPSNTYNAEHMVPSWDTTLTFGTIASSAVETFDITIERTNSLPIHTANQQNAHANFAGPLSVLGKLSFVYDNSDGLAPNVLVDALTRLQQKLSVVFTDPVTSHSITLQMTTCQLKNPVVKPDKSYLMIDCDFVAIKNATDATSGGTSPLKIIVVNGQATAA